jgi:anti-sigma regulatory factor (Ser/Thr protein kinase)
VEQTVEVLELEARHDAVGRARLFVSALLDRWQLRQLGPDASLVTSELVSNAVIHARTPIELRVAPVPDGVRIEVRDSVEYGINVAPADQPLAPRGLGLKVVAQLSARWGVDPVPDGKTVWAELTTSQAPGGSPAPEVSVGPAPLLLPDDWPEVRLVDVPTRLLLSWEQHVRDLMREFAIVSSHRRPLEEIGMDEPVELVVATLDRYWDLMRPIWSQTRPAEGQRPGHISFVVKLPESVVSDGPRFLEALDAADDLGRQGKLLTEAASDEVAAFRRWFVYALVRQVATRSPEEERAPFRE